MARLMIAAWCLTACALETTAVRSEAPTATMSAPELRARLLEAHDKIHSFRVVYVLAGKIPRDSADRYVVREVIAKGAYCLRHYAAHGNAALDWRDDPGQQIGYVTGASFYYNAFPVNREYFRRSLKPDAALPGTLRHEVIFGFTGLWPLTARESPRTWGLAPLLRQIALSDKYALVRPRQEMVTGRWCHVLERKGVDVLWIDVEHGCSLAAREYFDPETGRRVGRIELSQEEVRPGVWFPRRIHNIQFDFRSAPGKMIIDSELSVLEISVNDIDDSAFDFKPLPGSVSWNGDVPGAIATQSEPGGLDHLERLVEWTKRVCDLPASHNNLPFGKLIGYLSGLPIILLVVLLEVRRRTR